GFTPEPPDPPDDDDDDSVPPDDGGGNDGDDDSDDGGVMIDNPDDEDTDAPTDYVIVRLDQCDLNNCAGLGDTDGSQGFEPLASIDNDDSSSQLLIPSSNNQSAPEVLVLVHQGSGWIVEYTISDVKNTPISVPYPGQWEVFLLSPPQFVTDGLMDVTGLNLAQLHADLANAPLSLGMVEANTESQLIKCPIACVTEVAAMPEALLLPETGADKTNSYLLPFIGDVFLWLLIFLAYRAYRLEQSQS
ncbi:MAG: hypothetical protein GY869_17005, partial [Planctomycetes bacterium]|nr:hypothetical protein [Planctomycetota bacterium]